MNLENINQDALSRIYDEMDLPDLEMLSTTSLKMSNSVYEYITNNILANKYNMLQLYNINTISDKYRTFIAKNCHINYNN